MTPRSGWLRADLRPEVASGQRLPLFGLMTAMFSLAGLVWAGVTLAG